MQGAKEPDVFLEFERLSLLIEAKLGDGHQQSPRQWAAEVAARLQREEVDRSIPVWLLAMGGMGEEPSRTIVIPIREEAERLLHDTYRFPDVPVLLATCSWRHLLTALAETTKQIDTQSDTGIGYVIADLVEILRFHGIRYSHWLEELLRPQVLPLRTAHVESAVTLGEWVGPPKSAIRAERSPWFIAPDLRGIRDQAILTLGEIIYGH